MLILGGGPNRIGQGIEFDYCCCHASFALRDAGECEAAVPWQQLHFLRLPLPPFPKYSAVQLNTWSHCF